MRPTITPGSLTLRTCLTLWGTMAIVPVLTCQFTPALARPVALSPTHLAQTPNAGSAQDSEVQPLTFTGSLDSHSPKLPDGSYYHTHTFPGIAGQSVAIELTSEDFDAYLLLQDATGQTIAENDDGNGRNALIVIMLPTTGTYTLVANSFTANSTGAYRLTLRSATPQDQLLAEAIILTEQALPLYQEGRYAEAIPLVQRILALKEEVFGPNHYDVAASLSGLALLYQEQGEYETAKPLAQRALEIVRTTLGENHPDVATGLNGLANLYQLQGDYATAIPLYQQALQIIETTLGPNHRDLAIGLNNLARVYQAQGNYAAAEPLYQQALEILSTTVGKDHPDYASSVNNLAELYQTQGNYILAEPLYQHALQIRATELGESHPYVATSLNNLANLYSLQGNYSAAEPLYQRALQILETAVGENHPDVAQTLNNLGDLYRRQENYAAAEPLHQRALRIREATLGKDHPNVAQSLTNLAVLYQSQGNYQAAVPLYVRSQEILEATLGEMHPDVAQNLNNLAILYQDQGDYGTARQLLERSLQIREQVLGETHPDLAQSLTNLAGLSYDQGDLGAVTTFLQRSLAIEETNLALNLTVGSEARKRAYLDTLDNTTNGVMALHLQLAPENGMLANLALTTLLQRKGRILDATANSLQSIQNSLSPEDQALLEQFRETQSQLSTLLYRGLGDSPTEAYRQQVSDLRAQAEDLENQLAQRSAAFRQEIQLVTIAAVQAEIPDDAVLIEFVRYVPFQADRINVDTNNPATQWQEPRYAAYILLSQGQPRWVDLGEAAALDELMSRFRRDLASRRVALRASGRALDAALMQPIQTLLGEQTHLLISPDSELNLIPFAALIDDAGHYLTERYQMTYLTSGRDLLKLQLQAPSRQGPMLLANPDYAHPGRVVAPLPGAVTGPETGDLAATRATSQAAVDFADLTFKPLPGTATEIAAIAPLFPNATVFTTTAATENALKQAQAPSILHSATHGFFIENSALDNPLLRSGLALAGANLRQSGDEDGVLTGLEAAGLNLYGTQLVVLSACETGLGDVANGEGVYGLRRAFTLAGAESQLMSLWQVSDEGTSDLMQRYYRNLQTGMGRSEALRQVQLEMIADPTYSHPFYWAAFIFSGNWSGI